MYALGPFGGMMISAMSLRLPENLLTRKYTVGQELVVLITLGYKFVLNMKSMASLTGKCFLNHSQDHSDIALDRHAVNR